MGKRVREIGVPAVLFKPESAALDMGAKPFPTPSEVKMESGFGATKEDLRRGFTEPEIKESPKYDCVNYTERATWPSHPDGRESGNDRIPDDLEFQMKGRETPGLLTRPHRYPNER